MTGTVCEESAAGRSLEGLSSVHDSQYGEAMTEWRSTEQVENGMPSTSPPYWDTDDSDDDGGPKPSDLYGKYTWKIEKFSTINKRELKSSAFEIGGYKWYILIYPQGCDVCNHLSLFLCVANHDKLLPGWSHLAQFTIAVVNKDPKKSKYSDTLHRFWKKEHDWGWKKFMELSKVSDGFVDADTLIVKAQVQVVREKADRPFRCLHSQYRREFVRVYLSNVEQICRRFVDERRDKLVKLVEDKARWSSFCAFWREIDRSVRHFMSRDKMDPILKMIVKHFFLEKEVTSTLVMDSLYSGLKALEGQNKCIIGKAKFLKGADIIAPVIQVEKDMFVLVDDVLSLLEKATMDPLPPKDEKGPQNRTKDGGSGEDFYKDSIERDERRLTELGRRTVEIFVLTHIFSKIEAAYQEAVSLRRQEELIQEEKVESEQKAKRVMAEKEKRSKKKQGKQKRNNRKAKDKVKDEKPGLDLEDEHIHGYPTEVKDLLEDQTMVDKDEAPEDASETSDSVEGSTEVLPPDSEDREASPVNWNTDTSVVHQLAEASGSAVGNDLSSYRQEVDKGSSVMDDSSSTCSTDSASSLVINGSYKAISSTNNKTQKSPTRGKNRRTKASYREASGSNEADTLIDEAVIDLHISSDKAAESIEYEAALSSSQEPMKPHEQTIAKKEEVIPTKEKPSSKSQMDSDRQRKEKAPAASFLPQSPPRNKTLTVQRKSEPTNAPVDLIPEMKVASDYMQQRANKAASAINLPQTFSISKLAASSKSTENLSGKHPSLISRPSSTPLIPASKPAITPVVSMVQTSQPSPVLSRSASATGHLGPDSSPAIRSYTLQPSRNAILGNVPPSLSLVSYPPLPSPSSKVNPTPSSSSPSPSPSPSFSRPSSLVPGPIFIPRATEKVELKSVNHGNSYGDRQQQWLNGFQREASSASIGFETPSMLGEIQNLEPYHRPIHAGSREIFRLDPAVSTSDEFPHLDIINDLLDDEQGGPGFLDQRFNSPANMGMMGDLGLTTGSCRSERIRSYHEHLFQSDYASQGHHYDAQREYIPQSNTMPYMNEQMDGLVQNQWHVAGRDLLMRNNWAGDGYLYGGPEYSNLPCGPNGYAMFRPSNGH